MVRKGIWVGKTQKTALPIGTEWGLDSDPFHWGLLSVEGWYRGPWEDWHQATLDLLMDMDSDPVTIYLYANAGLVGYGPGYVDMTVSVYEPIRVSGQFRSSGRWRRVPREVTNRTYASVNLSQFRRRVGA